MKMLEIYLHHLTPEMQKEVLAFYNIETEEDRNLDIAPLFVLETEED